MNKHQLITAFKAMMYVAREEGIEIAEKYEQLDEFILQNYDYSVTDMMANLDTIYEELKKIV